MRATPLLALLALALVAPSLTGAQAPPPAKADYQLLVACPQVGGVDVDTAPNLGACPLRVDDEQDMMGDPSLAVDPFDPNNLVIGSLHGGVYLGGAAGTTSSLACLEPGPTPKSRCGQLFTTFTSVDHGGYWQDNPFVAPGPVNGAFGEHPQVTIDPYGHVYVGSLYAVPTDGGPFRYSLGAQKFGSLQTVNEEQNSGDYNAEYLDPMQPGGQISQFWFLFNPRTDNMTIVWHELPGTVAPPGSDPPPPPCPLPVPDPLPCVPPASRAWQAGASAWQAPDNLTVALPGGRIVVLWTEPNENATYNRQPAEWSIGPCSATTNPVLESGYLYIGCVADPASGVFPWHPETVAGTVELFRMDPDGGMPEYMGAAPVGGGSPKLGVRSDGRLALFTAGAAEDGSLQVAASYGRHLPSRGIVDWSTSTSYGPKIRAPDPDLMVSDAHLQNLVYREHSGVVHFILRETVGAGALGTGSTGGSAGPHIKKSLVAVDEHLGVLLVHDLDIGNPANRTDAALLTPPEASYLDLSDAFLQLPESPDYAYDGQPLGDHYQREFIAVGDYGIVLFAELIEITDLRGPVYFPPSPVAPAVASPAASGTPALLPVAGAIGVGALVASLIAARRKNPLAAITKGGKR